MVPASSSTTYVTKERPHLLGIGIETTPSMTVTCILATGRNCRDTAEPGYARLGGEEL